MARTYAEVGPGIETCYIVFSAALSQTKQATEKAVRITSEHTVSGGALSMIDPYLQSPQTSLGNPPSVPAVDYKKHFHLHLHIGASMCTWDCVRAHVCVLVCVSVCVRLLMCVRVCVCVCVLSW